MLFGKKPAVEWIAVFLGNPGPKYENTRHNAGFMAGAAAEKLFGVRMNRLRHRALTARADVGGHGLLLMEPQTYMNLSGEAVGEAARFYKVPAEHVIVVSDEMALPPGSLRIRQSGSAGGHNGLKSIIAHLGTDAFPRIRLGIGEPEARAGGLGARPLPGRGRRGGGKGLRERCAGDKMLYNRGARAGDEQI